MFSCQYFPSLWHGTPGWQSENQGRKSNYRQNINWISVFNYKFEIFLVNLGLVFLFYISDSTLAVQTAFLWKLNWLVILQAMIFACKINKDLINLTFDYKWNNPAVDIHAAETVSWLISLPIDRKLTGHWAVRTFDDISHYFPNVCKPTIIWPMKKIISKW